MMEPTKRDLHIIGEDIWWDTKLQNFRKKRLDLERVPLKFRCPNCGKILVPPDRRRETYTTTEKIDGEWTRITKPFPDWMVNPITWGGVCRDCYLDGFGRFGDRGRFIGKQIKDSREQGRLAYQKREQEEIAKYGKEPKYWLDAGFTKNPEWPIWWQRKIEIDRDDERMKNAKFVESQTCEGSTPPSGNEQKEK